MIMAESFGFQSKFDGGCLMYAKINANNSTDRRLTFKINYGSKSSCDYVIAIHVLFSVLYALGMGILHLLVILRRMRQTDIE